MRTIFENKDKKISLFARVFLMIFGAMIFVLGLLSCVDENAFPLSDRNKPTEIRIKNQISSSIKYGDGTLEVPDTAFVKVPDDLNLTQITIDYINLPSLTKVNPAINTVTNFINPQTFIITSESGKQRKFVVVVEYGEFTLQLPYYELNTWYKMGEFKTGDGYYNIGQEGKSTPWANTNTVAKILNKAACVPANFPSPTGHVVLGTLMNPTGGNTVGAGIASANIYTGAFRANPNFFLDRDKQRDNVDFGVQYRKRPLSVTFEYKYTPGTQVEKWIPCSDCGLSKWKGVDMSEKDSMEMFVLLQHRFYDQNNPSSTKYYRIAAGGFISSESVTSWRRITVPISYGKPTETFLAQNPQAYRIADVNLPNAPRMVYQHNPVQDETDPTQWRFTSYRIKEEWSPNPLTQEVTHLVLSFNSSAGGWEYKGAGTDINRNREGSKLEVRNVIFNE